MRMQFCRNLICMRTERMAFLRGVRTSLLIFIITITIIYNHICNMPVAENVRILKTVDRVFVNKVVCQQIAVI